MSRFDVVLVNAIESELDTNYYGPGMEPVVRVGEALRRLWPDVQQIPPFPASLFPEGSRSPAPAGPSMFGLSMIGTAVLTTSLRQSGYSVCILDHVLRSRQRWEHLQELLEAGPLAIGLSTTHLFDRRLIEKLLWAFKCINPRVTTILGGQTATRYPELASLEHADVTVFGEGERTVVRVIDAIKNQTPLSEIGGIAYKEGGVVKTTTLCSPMSMASEDYLLPDWSAGYRQSNECYFFETSRGCPYRCGFCAYARMYEGKVRYREPAGVVEELRRNYENWGIRLYRVVDSCFTAPKARIEAICNLIVKNNLPIEFSCFARADHLSPSMCDALRSAGCFGVFLGIESGDPEMLRRMRKSIPLPAALDGIGNARRAGLITHGNFVVGFPGETEASVERTREFVQSSGLDLVAFALFWLNNRCDVYFERESFGITGEGIQWCHSTMDSQEAIRQIARLREALPAGGPVLGSEQLFPVQMSLGFSCQEVLEYFRDLGLLLRATGPCRTVQDVVASLSGPVAAEVGEALARVKQHRVVRSRRILEYWEKDPLFGTESLSYSSGARRRRGAPVS